MTDGDGKQLVADVEVRTKGALHRSLATSNGKAQGNGDVIDDVTARPTRALKGQANMQLDLSYGVLCGHIPTRCSQVLW